MDAHGGGPRARRVPGAPSCPLVSAAPSALPPAAAAALWRCSTQQEPDHGSQCKLGAARHGQVRRTVASAREQGPLRGGAVRAGRLPIMIAQSHSGPKHGLPRKHPAVAWLGGTEHQANPSAEVQGRQTSTAVGVVGAAEVKGRPNPATDPGARAPAGAGDRTPHAGKARHADEAARCLQAPSLGAG